MKALTESEVKTVSGGGKDDRILAAIELTEMYYELNPTLEPDQEDIMDMVVSFYNDLKSEF